MCLGPKVQVVRPERRVHMRNLLVRRGLLVNGSLGQLKQVLNAAHGGTAADSTSC